MQLIVSIYCLFCYILYESQTSITRAIIFPDKATSTAALYLLVLITMPADALPKQKITGLYVDPLTTVVGTMRPHNSVEFAVGKLRTDVAKRVTENFQLEPELEPTMLEAKIYPSGEVYSILNDCNAMLI
jgi:hypothetical protein